MAAISFELKKLWKQKAFIIIAVIALLTTVYSVLSIAAPNYFNMMHEHPYEADVEDPKFLLNYSHELSNESYKRKLTPLEQSQKKAYERVEEVRYEIYLNKQSNENFVLEHNDEYLGLMSEKNRLFSELINLLDFAFIPELLDNIEYEKHELELLMNHGLVYESVESTGMTSSLVFRYGLDKLWGIIPVLVLALYAAISLSSEESSNSIEMLKTFPQKRSRIIINKFLSLLILGFYFILLTVLLVLLYGLIFGDGIGNLAYPVRVYAQTSYSIALWQYVLIAFGYFMAFMSLIFGLALLLGQLLRKPMLTSIVLLLGLFIGVILTQNNVTYQTWLNPLNVLNYRVAILGNRYRMSYNQDSLVVLGNMFKSFKVVLPLMIVGLLLSIMLINLKLTSNNSSKSKIIIFKHKNLHSLLLEFKKLKYVSSLTMMTGIVILIVSALLFQIMSQDQKRKHNVLQEYYTLIQYYEDVTDRLIQIGYDQSDVESRQAAIEEQEFILDSYNNKNLEVYYTMSKERQSDFFGWTIRRLELYSDAVNKQIFPQFENYEPNYFMYLMSRLYIGELLVRDIDPIMPGYVQFTPYDGYVSDVAKNIDRSLHTPSVMTGLNSLHRMNETYRFDLFIIVLVASLFGGGYVFEKEEGNQIVSLYTQPVSRLKIAMNKALSSISTSLLFLGGILGIVFLVGMIHGGVGQGNYPILHIDRLIEDPTLIIDYVGSYHFMDLSQYLVETVSLMVFGVIFLMSLSLFLSRFIKNRVTLFVVVLLVVLIPYGLTALGFLNSVAPFLPSTYLSAGQIVDGSMKVMAQSEWLTTGLGLSILGLFSTIFLILTIEISHKKEALS